LTYDERIAELELKLAKAANIKQVGVTVITRCMNRVRDEHGRKHPDYEAAAGDVCCHLAFFADWLREIDLNDERNAPPPADGAL
jgi:hypothetical protein